MKRDFAEADAAAPPAEQIELALARLEASAAFRGSPRHRALLRHLVERTLAGDVAALKETVLAIEVLGRDAARFDPKFDSIVRVEARRLRARLDDYHRGEGRDSALRIELPVGSYVPQFALKSPVEPRSESERRARGLVERGEHFLREALSKQTLETALARFDAAVRLAPDMARAYVGMGRAWLNLASGWHQPTTIATEHAADALRKALDLEPDQAVAHALLGAVQNQYERDWTAAQRSFRRAIALAPDDAFVHSAFGCHLFMRGRDAEAEHELLKARDLDPLYVNTRSHLATLRLHQGRLDEARAELDAMLDIAPESLAALGLAGLLALARGEHDEAIALYGRLCELLPEHPGCLASLAGAHAAAGDTARAEALLADLHGRLGHVPVSPYVMAIVATRLRRLDEAFDRLREADDARDPNALYIPLDPSFRGLHGDPRWPALARRVVRGKGRPTAG